MKITAVRVRKLVSGPGYNNTAVEAEAIVARSSARTKSFTLAVKHSLDTIGLAYGLADDCPF